jgi:nucleotide-binding universal stress UspA family protein
VSAFKKILVPVDIADADPAKPAISTAKDLADSGNADVRLVYVIPFWWTLQSSTCHPTSLKRRRLPQRRAPDLGF